MDHSVKAVFTDIDGTLLNSMHRVTPRTREQVLRIIRKGIPFEMRLYERPVFMDELTPEELEREIEKGIWSAEHEKTYTAEEVDEILKKEFGI